MYSPFQLGIRYVKYFLSASNAKGHGIHSPFVFSFITKVLNDDRQFYAFEEIENMRNLLFINQQKISIEDFGAGSRIYKNSERRIGEIAKSSLKPKKFGQLLFRIVNQYAPKSILELKIAINLAYPNGLICYLCTMRIG